LAIQIQGNGGVVAENDGETFDAMRVTVRPVDYGALGQYRLNMWANPVMAAGLAGGSDIWQARWTSTPQIAIIWGLDLDGFFASTAFAAGFANFSLTFARSWTADGSGGTAANLTGNNNKLRTSMGSSLMGAIRNATGSSTLTTGTRTLDAQALGILPCSTTYPDHWVSMGLLLTKMAAIRLRWYCLRTKDSWFEPRYPVQVRGGLLSRWPGAKSRLTENNEWLFKYRALVATSSK
jgi:hypothetical protein